MRNELVFLLKEVRPLVLLGGRSEGARYLGFFFHLLYIYIIQSNNFPTVCLITLMITII